MKIGERMNVTLKKNNTFSVKVDGLTVTDLETKKLSQLYKQCREVDESSREAILNDWLKRGEYPALNLVFKSADDAAEAQKSKNRTFVKEALGEMINFFSEFQFTPSFRFVNSLSHALTKSTARANDYIINYFRLLDSPYANELKEKIKSDEFEDILKRFALSEPTKTVNKRFRVYFGSQGTGKTTRAMSETENRVIVCNSSMLPCDVLEDFGFDDGKATFHPSALVKCMEEGKSIVLDEINLLPYDTLRFLQGILDDKSEFQYKGTTIHINDGFSIIGTMNLVVNGVAFGLPEPLVDRCANIEEFTLTPDMLMDAI